MRRKGNLPQDYYEIAAKYSRKRGPWHPRLKQVVLGLIAAGHPPGDISRELGLNLGCLK